MPFPVEARFIDQAEARLGVRFPPLYRAGMIRRNGGEVDAAGDAWELHSFLDTSDRRRLRSARNEIVQETTSDRERPAFPSGAVSIAGNGTPERLVLLPGAGGLLGETIHLWSPDGSLEPIADDLLELRPMIM